MQTRKSSFHRNPLLVRSHTWNVNNEYAVGSSVFFTDSQLLLQNRDGFARRSHRCAHSLVALTTERACLINDSHFLGHHCFRYQPNLALAKFASPFSTFTIFKRTIDGIAKERYISACRWIWKWFAKVILSNQQTSPSHSYSRPLSLQSFRKPSSMEDSSDSSEEQNTKKI